MSYMNEDFSFSLLCVVCTRTQMYIMCTCAYVYMPMCACGSQRTTLDTLSWELFTLFLRPGLGSLRLSSLPRLADWQAPGLFLCLLPQHADCRYAHHVSFLTWILRVKFRSFCVCCKSFLMELSPLPQACIIFLHWQTVLNYVLLRLVHL